MSSVAKVYHVESERLSMKKRVARAFLALAIFVAATYLFHVLWRPARATKVSSEEFIIDAVVAVATDFFSKRKAYDLDVDDETIRMRGDWPHKSVRRGHLRYLRESTGNLFREPALKLSEHGPIRTFFLGYVWIPTTLPEYEQIKAMAMSWMAIG